jgi:hypothetical protein
MSGRVRSALDIGVSEPAAAQLNVELDVAIAALRPRKLTFSR